MAILRSSIIACLTQCFYNSEADIAYTTKLCSKTTTLNQGSHIVFWALSIACKLGKTILLQSSVRPQEIKVASEALNGLVRYEHFYGLRCMINNMFRNYCTYQKTLFKAVDIQVG